MPDLQTARDHLARLVAFDTTSTTASTAEVVAWLADHLDRPGIEVWDLPDDQARTQVPQHNLLVRIGPDAPGAWVLSAHLDCVPVTGQPWTSDPFEVVERDGRLHGRGTTDMKGFVAACLAGLAEVDPASLRRPIVLALSHSEEIGTIGAPALVTALRDRLHDPELAIVGEPTSMQVIGAHKGVRGGWVTITGVDAHSSQTDRGASAVTAAARLIAHVADLGARRAQDGPHDARFHPSHTTTNVGLVEGGQAINIIPRQARFFLEYRPVPGEDPELLRREVREYAEQVVLPELARHVGSDRVGIEFEDGPLVEALAVEDDGPAERLARGCGAASEPTGAVAYGTDGGHLQLAGLSTVVCGPGSIDQAHQPDEWLAVDQLDAAVAFVRRLVDRASAP